MQTAGARIGKFVIQSVNTGEEMEVKLNLATGEVERPATRTCATSCAASARAPRRRSIRGSSTCSTGSRSGRSQKIQLVSGFRAPMFSLATLSYHTRGMAADIRIPGMTPLMVRDLAESMGVHGLGYYPVSGFVHVDVRDDYTRWTDYGQNRQDGEGPSTAPRTARTSSAARSRPARFGAGLAAPREPGVGSLIEK